MDWVEVVTRRFGPDTRPLGLPKAAVAICARDSGIDAGDLTVLSQLRRGRNWLFVVRAGKEQESSKSIDYLIKERAAEASSARWRVDLDHAGLSHVFGFLDGVPGCGVIRPIGYELGERRFLVSTYEKGHDLGELVHRAISTGAGMHDALVYAKRMGRWLAALRTSARKQSEPDELKTKAKQATTYLSILAQRRSSLQHVQSLTATRFAEWGEELCLDIHDAHPSHGDMGPQNFILGHDGRLYAIDFSAFGFRVLESDVARVRIRLEKAGTFCGHRGVERASRIWQSFWDEYIEYRQGSADLCLFSYIHKMTRMIVADSTKGRWWRSGRNIGRMIRDQRWSSGRCEWLVELPHDKSSQLYYFRNCL